MVRGALALFGAVALIGGGFFRRFATGVVTLNRRVGDQNRLIIRWSQVRILAGPPEFGYSLLL